ncbi:MAG: carboxypeptidase regulatory-like domain-containing protein [Gemmatimonadota bacterium]|nr:carboxypeptidase regulatory-like domain-containing protein [Gemmatimonadota bacterium]
MTDAGGQYSFAGLAAGDYTITIAVESDAYVFDAMSQDRAVGDDESAIVNFDGQHARTASVVAMLFVDEADKNDGYDDGEDAFPPAAVLAALQAAQLPAVPVPVTLTGPDLGTVRSGVMDVATGQITFSGLQAGSYSLQVGSLSALLAGLPPELAMVLQDYEYGGQAEGYAIDVAVGEEKTQHLPVDITHQTVHFAVTLKAGDARGMPVPGAMVTLYSGGSKVGDGATGETGVASIRFARAGASMVSAGVAVDGYHVAEGMTDVEWDAKSPHSQATNSNDIVNLNASFSFKGATLGGDALGGWAIGVTSGDDAVADAPAALGDDGSASFSETVAAGDLPKTYTIAVADDQEGKDADGNELDGGENYEADEVEYTHTGLMLAGDDAADAGTLVVRYTTQTLNVYVHEEKDQVMGYTGNVLGGDVRMSSMLDIELRYVQNGYRHQFGAADSIKASNKAGVYTFSNVPADKDVIVTADVSDTLDIMVVGQDAVTATGFGAQGGGSHHTVELCSLAPVEGQQRHDECATFAFVHTYAVDGQAWKYVVTKSGDDFAKDGADKESVTTEGIPGFTVNMDPVEDENLASLSADPFEAEKKSNKAFDFGMMPAGAYTVTINQDTDDWNIQRGPADDPTDDLADRISPLDSALNIDVSPSTGYVFGTVTDNMGRRVPGVTVDVNGATGVSDAQGRYIVEGFGPRSYRAPNATRSTPNRSIVSVDDPGAGNMRYITNFRFTANNPTRRDITGVDQAADVAVFSGRVTYGTGAGVPGVQILVDYTPDSDDSDPENPLNATYHTVPDPDDPGETIQVMMVRTDSNGEYTARVRATSQTTGTPIHLSARKEHVSFQPENFPVMAVVGANQSGVNFSATDHGMITGRVVEMVDGAEQSLANVLVRATRGGETAAADSTTTGAAGAYVLHVANGTYTVSAEKNGYTFDITPSATVPNAGIPVDKITGTAVMNNADLGLLNLSGVSLERSPPRTSAQRSAGVPVFDFLDNMVTYQDTVAYSVDMTTVTAVAAVTGAETDVDPGDDSSASGHQVALDVGRNDITVTVTALDGTTTKAYSVYVYRSAEETIIQGTVTDADGVGMDSVTISVSGRKILNPNRRSGAYWTNAAGQFSVRVESGGTATVTPSKAGVTFTPLDRSVTLTPNATVTGIDFEGGGNSTITGRVVAGDPAVGLAGATVTASPRGGTGGPSTVTRSTGNFTIRNVPNGWRTVTVELDGYSFESRDVHVDGGTVDIGDLEAMGTIQPANVMAVRDPTSTTDGAFDGDVTVTWRTGGAAAASYQVQSCVVAADDPGTTDTDESTNCDETPATGVTSGWADLGSAVTTGEDGLFTLENEALSGVADHQGGFKVRVQATDSETPPNTLTSMVEDVPEIDVAPRNAAARRVNPSVGDDLVEVTWTGQWSTTPASAGQIIASFDDGENWISLVATGTFARTAGTGTPPADNMASWTFVDVASSAYVDEDTGTEIPTGGEGVGTVDPTPAQLNGEFLIRLLTRQEGVDEGVDEDDNAIDLWNSSGDLTVPPAGN